MSSTPVVSRNVLLLVHSESLLLPISLGRIDEFSANSNTDIVKRRPMGKGYYSTEVRNAGYELSFKLDKRDPMLERWNYLIESGKISNKNRPNLFISETTKHYGGGLLGIPVIENWIYKNVVLYGFNKSTNISNISQEIKGFASHKELGPVNTTYINLNWTPQMLFQDLVKNEAENDTIGNLLGAALNFL
jgi:hypothetical protein